MENNEMQKIKTVPENYTSITPWIISPSSRLIEFLTAAFEAEEIPNSRIVNEDGLWLGTYTRLFEFICG
jgi:PhnB protein